MQSYRFRYMHGQSMPYATLYAENDADFFNNKLPAWERETGLKYIPYSVTCTVSETRRVPEPVIVAAQDHSGQLWAGLSSEDRRLYAEAVKPAL